MALNWRLSRKHTPFVPLSLFHFEDLRGGRRLVDFWGWKGSEGRGVEDSFVDDLGFGGQAIDHYITYSVISAKPQLSYSSVVSTVRCFPITSGRHEGHTFVQWSGNFSSDADAGMSYVLSAVVEVGGAQVIDFCVGVIQDAKFKRREALADLANAVPTEGVKK
jgi:hypothetical protein